jgi:hypothetical protein
MNKDEFNKLQIIQQIQLINEMLEDKSLTKACEDIGIDRATIRKRFKTRGYILDKELNKYIIEVKNINPLDNKSLEKESNTLNTVKNKPLKRKQNNKDTKTLEAKINSLQEQIKDIYSLINTISTKNTSIEDIEPKEFKKYSGNEVVRSYRLNEEIQKRFKVFCKKNSDAKVGDLVNMALEEFINKYN